jgi:hypothetical protein
MSFAMAFVVLFSTMSFTVNMHFCGETLMDSAIYQNAKTCGMEMENPFSKSCSITKKNCCSNEVLVVEGQDDLQLQVDKISFEQQLFIASFVYTYINLFEGLENKAASFEAYKPPLVVKDIFKIDETYLI